MPRFAAWSTGTSVARRCFDVKRPDGLCLACHASDADEAAPRYLDPDAITGAEELQRPGKPRTATGRDEAVLYCVLPRALDTVAEGGIELSIPRFIEAFRSGGADLGADGVE